VEWLRLKMENSQVTEAVELSLRKKFKKSIWCKFAKAINEYELVQPGDRIAVCISGGKDSMLMAKLFQELKRHDKFPFEVVFLVMDPGYSPENRRVIEKMHGQCPYPYISLSRISSIRYIISRRTPAISARE